MHALRKFDSASYSVKSPEEIHIIVRILESLIGSNYCIAAPEIGINRFIGIIRTPYFSFDIVNPKIVFQENLCISLQERCFSYENEVFNCERYKKIIMISGLEEKKYVFYDNEAVLIQHCIDHFFDISFHERMLKAKQINNNLISGFWRWLII